MSASEIHPTVLSVSSSAGRAGADSFHDPCSPVLWEVWRMDAEKNIGKKIRKGEWRRED